MARITVKIQDKVVCPRCKRILEATSVGWGDASGTIIRVEAWCRPCRSGHWIDIETGFKPVGGVE